MHEASFLKMKAFRDCYLAGPKNYRVLDVGSRAIRDHDSYRRIFDDPRFDYVGLDIEPGPNVDIVPSHAYRWTEIETSSFDVVVSGQVLEHNPFFWISIAEVARVLRPHGILCLIAPSKGPVHRYPFDCWRFYPDAPAAIFAFVGLELLESYTEQPSRNKIVDTVWGDMFAIGRKPLNINMDRLERIVALAPDGLPDPSLSGQNPAIELYESQVMVPCRRWYQHRLRKMLSKLIPTPVKSFLRKIS